MFRKYVMNARAQPVDIGRAQFLMDKDLIEAAVAWVDANWPDIARRGGGGDRDQAFWDYYCQRHFERHGTFFEPDVNPQWN